MVVVLRLQLQSNWTRKDRMTNLHIKVRLEKERSRETQFRGLTLSGSQSSLPDYFIGPDGIERDGIWM